MQLEEISFLLKEEARGLKSNVLANNPYEIANFLLCCGNILLKFAEHSNLQLNEDSKGFLSTAEMEKIRHYFEELGQNFFPMAHTSEPLGHLHIVDKKRSEELRDRLQHLSVQHGALMQQCFREAGEILLP